MKRMLAFVMILLLAFPSLAYADTQTDSKSLFDRVTDHYWFIYQGEGIISTTLTYSKVTSPSGSIKKGTAFPVSGTLKLQSLTGNSGKILSIRFSISETGIWGKNVANREYSINKKQVNLGDYSSAIAQDIASLPTGDYRYSLSVTYKGKIDTETETIASSTFSISDDGKSYDKPEISISGSSGTSAMTAGTGFAITGKIKTSHGKLTKVVVQINGKTVRTFTPNSATFDLGTNVGTMPETKQLDGGSHYYSVIATAENGYHKVEETVIGQRVSVSGTLPQKQYKISISSVSAPSSLKKGSNYGLRGVITAENCTLTRVSGQVISAAGKTVLSGSRSLDTTSHDIRNSINNDLKFGKLSSGTYTYILTATAVTASGETVQETLVQKTFTVYSETSKPSKNEDYDDCEDQEVDVEYEEEEETTAKWSSWGNWTYTRKTITDPNAMQEESATKAHWWAAKCKSCGQHNPYWGSKTKCVGCGAFLPKDNYVNASYYSDDTSGTTLDGRSNGRTYNGKHYWYHEMRTVYRYRTRID